MRVVVTGGGGFLGSHLVEHLERDGHDVVAARRRDYDLTSYDDWRGALVDDLLVPVDDVTDAEWHSLWDRTQASHRAWDEAGRP